MFVSAFLFIGDPAPEELRTFFEERQKKNPFHPEITTNILNTLGANVNNNYESLTPSPR